MSQYQDLIRRAEQWERHADEVLKGAKLKADLLLQKATVLRAEAAALVPKHAAASPGASIIAVVEEAAQKALNAFNSELCRRRMREVRIAQGDLLKLDQMDLARGLDRLHTRLRERAEKLEYAALSKRLRISMRGADQEEIDSAIEREWTEYRRRV